MKSLWSAMSFLAIAHLLALGLFTGWLWQSDRLNRERIESVRDLFAPTIAEAETRAAAEAEEIDELRRHQETEERRQRLPMSSEMQIQHISHLEEIERRTVRNLENERAHLIRQLDETHARLEARQAEFEAEREAWEAAIEAERTRRTDEQFVKAVQQLESIPPRQGREILKELVRNDRMDQAVAYLNAMNARPASKILEQFRTDDEIRLATELLERLREFGLNAELARDDDHADRTANAQ